MYNTVSWLLSCQLGGCISGRACGLHGGMATRPSDVGMSANRHEEIKQQARRTHPLRGKHLVNAAKGSFCLCVCVGTIND